MDHIKGFKQNYNSELHNNILVELSKHELIEKLIILNFTLLSFIRHEIKHYQIYDKTHKIQEYAHKHQVNRERVMLLESLRVLLYHIE